MILLIEPVSKNIGMYVPAYPLPILEIASFIKSRSPEAEVEVISIPMDYGLPLTPEGRERVYKKLIEDIGALKPKGIGISCTAISQAEETIHLSELIKKQHPEIIIFIGGYFPTIYYEEIFSKTLSVDIIVAGEGEISCLNIVEKLSLNEDPRTDEIPNLIWKENGALHFTEQKRRFDLNWKSPLRLELLKNPHSYDIIPYSFSRGCPYKCNFCMEDYIRPARKAVPKKTIEEDIRNLSHVCNTSDIVVCDALFKSFDLIPLFRELRMKIHFETRCDVMDSAIIPSMADVSGTLVLGFESASYNTLRRMNKVRDREHYMKYITNAQAIFREAVRCEIPVMVFMIAGYPGDTEDDLKESLNFVKELSKNKGAGGHVFKIGECHVYPKTKIHDLAEALPDITYDNDGVFGQNIVRKPSKDLDFHTVLLYIKEIYGLSNNTSKLQEAFLKMIPFFRLPVSALNDPMIPAACYKDNRRDIFNVDCESLANFINILPELWQKNKEGMSKERSNRILKI